MYNYYIKSGYHSRIDNDYYDDTEHTDDRQKEVYQYARYLADKHGYTNIMDIGTGSGYKLLNYFKGFNTLGIDLPPTVEWLRRTYPDHKWSDEFIPVSGYDIIIASDVIEHIPYPETLIDLIKKCNPKLVIFSTPDRDLKGQHEQDGPPANPAHVREWTMPEFKDYIGSEFNVIKQYIFNKAQGTQVVLAELKE
jgi:2-polyprenyl-3-methyl-5-hydroxy-6-metoxy-1,4-benzoquinol methylase